MSLPRSDAFDETFAFIREGYRFVGRRCDRFGSSAFETRIMLRPVLCVRGREAAEIFYDEDRFTRSGAMPVTIVKLLQDFGSVQTLDGPRHRHRKAMFLALLTGGDARRLAEIFEVRLRQRLLDHAGAVVLFDVVRSVLTEVALEWTGTPLAAEAAHRRCDELSEMIERSGSLGPKLWRALWLRSRCESWARGLVEDVRRGAVQVAVDSPLAQIAAHRDADGRLLETKIAAVELINLLRPIVAVSRFIVFAAKALEEQLSWREKIISGDEQALALFVEEVRRLSPFFPVIGGRVARPFTWRGHAFEEGRWVLLDLYGTNHDPALWPNPDSFRPERLADQDLRTAHAFVPQGAGKPAATHRCPGEDATVALMSASLRVLSRAISYTVPAQDLSVDLSRIPALPRSGFVIDDIRVRG